MQSDNQTVEAKMESLPARVAQRFDEFEATIATVEAELAEDHFSTGVGKFREAVNLSRGFPKLEERVGTLAIEQAEKFLSRSWPIAKSLLLEAGEVGSGQAKPQRLWDDIQLKEREASILSELNAASLASSIGLTPLARQRLAVLVAKYPGDPRAVAQLNEVEAQGRSGQNNETLRRVEKEEKAVEETRLLARTTHARAREFQKGGFHAEALEQWQALSMIDPHYPGLETEIARVKSLAGHSQDQPAVELMGVQEPRIAAKLGAESGPPLELGSGRIKTSATLIFATAALAASGVLLWIHATRGVVKPEPKHQEVSPPLAAAVRSTTSVFVSVPEKAATPPPAAVTVVEVKQADTPTTPQQNSSSPVFESADAATRLEHLPLLAKKPLDILPPTPQLGAEDLTGATAIPAIPEIEKKADAESEAWSAVNLRDPHSMENYLSRFPNSINRPVAERAMTEIRTAEAAKRQSEEVLAVVQQYAAAWSARNVDSILSLQHYLDRRSVKAQLAPLKSLAMTISPAAGPSIEGAQATLLCYRQVSQVFQDGVEKTGPQQTVTFVLSKRGGSWTIDDTRQ